VWRPGLSKVQFGQYHIGPDSRRLGSTYPNFTAAHTPEWARRMSFKNGFYEMPPTSGNAWARGFIAAVLPLEQGSIDDYLSWLAPRLGDVVSWPGVLGEYRWHTRNKSLFGKFAPERFARNCDWDVRRLAIVNKVLRRHGKEPISLDRSWDHLANHIVYKRFLPGSYPYPRAMPELASLYFRAVASADESAFRKLKLFAWGASVCYAPLPMARLACHIRESQGRKLFESRLARRTQAAVVRLTGRAGGMVSAGTPAE
jgi:hypothetical protein